MMSLSKWFGYPIKSELMITNKSIFQYIFGVENNTRKVIMIGLDAAGKTTLLYRLSHGREVNTTIPTIGFNVETIELKSSEFVCWDVGGCDKIRPLWRHYLKDREVMIVVVDSRDNERIDDLYREISTFIEEHSMPMLVLANKQDLPEAMTIATITDRLCLNSLTDRYWEILPISAVRGDGLDQVLPAIERVAKLHINLNMKEVKEQQTREYAKANEISEITPRNDSLLDSISHNSTPLPIAVVPTNSTPDTAYVDHQKRTFKVTWNNWIQRPVLDNDDNILEKLRCYELDIWDHYTHVRIAYIFLLRHGKEEGCRHVVNSLADFIANSPRTQMPNGGDGRSFHHTMTRFWCSLIYYWIECYSYHIHIGNVRQDVSLIIESDFHGFLRFVAENCDATTDIVDKGLFRQYYSTSVIFGEAARNNFVPPDIKEFPESYQYMV